MLFVIVNGIFGRRTLEIIVHSNFWEYTLGKEDVFRCAPAKREV